MESKKTKNAEKKKTKTEKKNNETNEWMISNIIK